MLCGLPYFLFFCAQACPVTRFLSTEAIRSVTGYREESNNSHVSVPFFFVVLGPLEHASRFWNKSEEVTKLILGGYKLFWAHTSDFSALHHNYFKKGLRRTSSGRLRLPKTYLKIANCNYNKWFLIVRYHKWVYIYLCMLFIFTFKSSIQQPDDGPDRDQSMYLHHHKYEVVLNWKYKILFVNN